MPNCKRCGTLLIIGETWRPSVAVRKHLRCKACISTDRKQYYQEHKETITKSLAKYRIENRAQIMLTRVKGRAKKEGIPFDLTLEDIVIPNRCPIFNKPFTYGKGHKFNPSVDRIDSNGGYTKGNIQIISMLANTMKNGATLDELYEFCHGMLAHMGYQIKEV